MIIILQETVQSFVNDLNQFFCRLQYDAVDDTGDVMRFVKVSLQAQHRGHCCYSLLKLRSNKAPGPDSLGAHLLKDWKGVFSRPFNSLHPNLGHFQQSGLYQKKQGANKPGDFSANYLNLHTVLNYREGFGWSHYH